MSQPASHIGDTRKAIGRLTDAFEEVVAKLGEFAALGGAEGVRPFFQTVDPETGETVDRVTDPRFEQYIAAMNSIQAFRDLANSGHAANLYRVKP
jgi:hypothetical protein